MTYKDYIQTIKNLGNWLAFIEKMEGKDNLTEDQLDDLVGRRAQCVVWARHIRTNKGKFEDEVEVIGSMSASSSTQTAESAGATDSA